jgi:hypothetical protein
MRQGDMHPGIHAFSKMHIISPVALQSGCGQRQRFRVTINEEIEYVPSFQMARSYRDTSRTSPVRAPATKAALDWYDVVFGRHRHLPARR